MNSVRNSVVCLVAVLATFLCLQPIVPSTSARSSRGRTYRDPAPPPAQGQSRTLLPNGLWLLMGGVTRDGVSDDISIWNPNTNSSTTLRASLLKGRAWHTATLLPDGTVLVFGGIGADGQLVQRAETFDPSLGYCHIISVVGLDYRAHHTATVLTNGSVLIAGGVGMRGDVLASMQMWNPRNGTAEAIAVIMITARWDQTASIEADGTVLFTGGIDQNNLAIRDGEVYDPLSQTERIETNPNALQPQTAFPFLAASIPIDDSTGFPVNGLISLRFSTPLAVQSVNTMTIILNGPSGKVSAKVVPLEGGMLAFVTPSLPLAPMSSYTLVANGPVDVSGRELSEAQVSFTTAGASVTVPSPVADPDLGPPTDNWSKLPPLQAPPGVTALAGRVLRLSGAPLPHVRLQIDEQTTFSDSTGRFLLENIGPGHHAMIIDGSHASSGGRTYGIYLDGVDIKASQTNALDYTIWMTRINTHHAITIPSPTKTETVITSPLMPGFELRIPPHTVIKDLSGKVVTRISITPIPVTQPPFPLPAGAQVPEYFTIQPGGAYIVSSSSWAKGAQLYYPNFRHAKPGAAFDFWNYDAYGKGWYVYGKGRVNASATQIVPDPGVEIYEFTGAMVASGLGPASGPPPGGSRDADPVDLFTGLFVYRKMDLILPDIIPIVLKRTHRPGDLNSYAFGIGTNHLYGIYLEGDTNPYTYQNLVLSDGGIIPYNRTSPGTGYADAVYQNTSSPTGFLGSTISWNGTGWSLKLKDGTTLLFPDSENVNSPRQAALIGIQDRYGNRLKMVLDSNGNPAEIISPSGRWVQLTYDSLNRITQAQDISGRVVTYSYDSYGRLATVTDPNGGVTSYGYDSSNNMTTITDARGILYLTNQYDSNGRVSQQTLADGSVYQFSYTTDQTTGNVVQTNVTDPMGNIRRVTFNTDGYAVTDTRAVGRPEQQTFAYSRQTGTDMPLTVTDPLGRVTRFSYDNLWNLTSLTRLATSANPVTTTFTFNPHFSQIASVTDPLGHSISFNYDSSGNLIQSTDALGNQTSFGHNSAGQITSIIDPLGNTTQIAYDGGDLVSVTDPLGRTTSYFRDVAGRLLSVTDPGGESEKFSYDPLNDVTAVTNPVGGITSYAFDPNGDVISVTDANNHSTSYTYNSMDRLATRTDALQRVESYVYDGDGNLTTYTDRRGKVLTFRYDGLNRRTFVGFGTQTGPPYESTINYTYDAGNRLTQVVDSIAGTISRTPDDLDRMQQETTPQGTTSYSYDAASRRTSMTVGNQAAISYSYDSRNRLAQITQGNNQVSFGYDAAGRRTALTLPNGIAAAYSYDAASQLVGLTYTLSSINWGTLAYTYDLAGRRTSLGGSLASVDLPLPVSQTAYDAANELTLWGTATPVYDANGNMLSDGTNTYSWDARNRLVSMNAGAESFQYDPFGRRAGKTVVSATTNYVYDGANPVQELSNGAVTANLLTGGIDEYIQRTDANGPANFLTDTLGSTIALTDSSANTSAQYSYEPFGNTAEVGASSNSYQFTGRENDGTGVYFYRNRYYSPTLQRFISEDPIGLVSRDVNFYAYAYNDPTRYRDPNGTDPIIGVTVGVIAGGIYGGLGAYLAGGNATEILEGGGIGALGGGLIGAFDPSAGVGTLAIIGGAAGGLGDIAGQVMAGRGGKCNPINWGSTIGAVAGGALGGAGGAALGADAAALGLPEVPATAGATSITSGPGTLLPGIGGNLWPSNTAGRSCN